MKWLHVQKPIWLYHMDIFKDPKWKISAKSLTHSKENFSLAMFQFSKIDQNKVLYNSECAMGIS